MFTGLINLLTYQLIYLEQSRETNSNMTDPIADMLTRIRNALAVRKPEVILPFSKIKMNIAEILQQLNYVNKVEKVEKGAGHPNYDQIMIILK